MQRSSPRCAIDEHPHYRRFHHLSLAELYNLQPSARGQIQKAAEIRQLLKLQPDRREIGRIRSGPDRPEQAFAAVQYRGQWFWIDYSDWLTKRALSAVMFFCTMADTGTSEQLPLVTIPAQ